MVLPETQPRSVGTITVVVRSANETFRSRTDQRHALKPTVILPKVLTRRWVLLLATLAVTAILAGSAACTEDDESSFVVIKAGRIITLAGQEYLRGEIVLADGRVRLVGKSLDYPASAKKIDASREVVMPGMIHPRSRWELPRYSRSGLHGDRSAAKEVYLDQIDLQPLVEAGFTAVCIYPEGTGVTGPSNVYRTAGPDESRDLGAGYVRITMSSPSRDKKVLRDAIDKARKEIEKVEKARKEWDEKQKKAKEEAAKKAAEASKEGEEPVEEKKDEPSATADGDEKEPEKKDGADDAKGEEKKPEEFTPPKIDPAVMPFVLWIRDKKGPPLLFELARASDLLHLDDALSKASELPAALLYLAGASHADYQHVLQQLGDRESVALVQSRMGQLPNTVTRYNLPAELALSGCSVAMLPAADTTSELRSFRAQMADLVRAGLPREEALKAVTLYPAQALGMADQLGTIEKGKHADLIFLDGDPLNPHTRVTRVMIDGEIVWEASR